MPSLPPYPYPAPADNPRCICKHGSQQFFCTAGHLTECHIPMSCWQAACSHLEAYELDPAAITQLRLAAPAHRAANGYPEQDVDHPTPPLVT